MLGFELWHFRLCAMHGLQDWLGIGHIEPAALWGLFLAFATSIMQVRLTTGQDTPISTVPSLAVACCRCTMTCGTTAPTLHRTVRGQHLHDLWQEMK